MTVTRKPKLFSTFMNSGGGITDKKVSPEPLILTLPEYNDTTVPVPFINFTWTLIRTASPETKGPETGPSKISLKPKGIWVLTSRVIGCSILPLKITAPGRTVEPSKS